MIDDAITGILIDSGTTLAIPVSIFTDIVPSMTDMAEVQSFLTVTRLALLSGDLSTPIEEPNIVRDPSVRRALRVIGSGNEADNRIATGLELAVGRGVLIRFRTVDGRDERVWYLLATEDARLSVERMLAGVVLPPRSLWTNDKPPRVEPERPTVFRLYEQNIGLLSPIIADQIVRAMERYPRDWIEDAIGEAVVYNRRNWRYIQRILQNWAATGRSEDRPGADVRR